MRLNAPKAITFWIAVALVIIGIALIFFVAHPWPLVTIIVGFLVLMLGNLVKGM